METPEITMLRQRAQAGDANAMTALGKRLLIGAGVRQSPQEGISFIQNAASRGNAEATAQLGLFAAWALMRPRNLNEGFDLLQRAAESGWEPAQRELRMLARGEGSDWKALRLKIDVAAWTKAPPGRTASEAPRILVFEGFCSAVECEWLIALAGRNLKRALIYRHDTPGHASSDTRTNTEAELTVNNADIVLNLVTDRVAAAAGVPTTHFEVSKLLHYEPGQQFSLHSDFLSLNSPALIQDVQRFGQRTATFLIYLNDDFEGGETDFPKIDFRFKGKRGDALMFYNVDRTGAPDFNTLHAGLPPTRGVKWLFSQWIRSKPLRAA